MKLLICTQKVDREDRLVGFFEMWLREFAAHFEQITVIALGVGDYELPANVIVHSLGKEKGVGKLGYIRRYLPFIIRKRNEYDVVFVHMSKEFLVLGGIFFWLFRKPVALWYNHIYGDWLARLSFLFADRVLFTSPFAYSASSHKSLRMPAGITVGSAQGDNERPIDFLYLGRISPVKNIDTIADAFVSCAHAGARFKALMVGDATVGDEHYLETMKTKLTPLIEKGMVEIRAGVPYRDTAALFRQSKFSLNATNSGSFDKVVLESMREGSIPILSNESFRGTVPDEYFFKERDSGSLAAILNSALHNPKGHHSSAAQKLREWVIKEHGLPALARALRSLYTELCVQ